MVCPRCGRENDAQNQFCGRCGLEFAQVEQSSQNASDARPCSRHPREMTVLSCGKCGVPICHRCVVIGPAGPRCKDCARNKLPISARTVAGEAKIGFRRLFQAGPFVIYWWIVIIVLGVSLVRGCASMSRGNDGQPSRYSREQAGE